MMADIKQREAYGMAEIRSAEIMASMRMGMDMAREIMDREERSRERQFEWLKKAADEI
jgi:hypothetical protein